MWKFVVGMIPKQDGGFNRCINLQLYGNNSAGSDCYANLST